MNSALGENSKEPSSSIISAEASFDDDSNNVKVLAAIIGEKWQINYIQTLSAQVQQSNHYEEMYSMSSTTHFKNGRIRITR